MTATVNGNESFFTAWMDKKPVHVLSAYDTMVTQVPRVRRDNQGHYERVRIKRPDIIGHYNKGMGGTDLFGNLDPTTGLVFALGEG